MINCKICKNKKNCVYAGADRETEECVDRIPTTHSDIIRSMTDEELAKYFAWLVDDEFPPCCEWEMYGDTIQINAWLEWLTEEVKT